MNKRRYSTSSVLVYKHGLYGYRTFVRRMPVESLLERPCSLTAICERQRALTRNNNNLPVFSWSLYRDSVIKITSQPTGITAKHNFRENRSLFARVRTRIASLLTHTTLRPDNTAISEFSSRYPAEKIGIFP